MKKGGETVSGSSLGENTLLMPEDRGEWQRDNKSPNNHLLQPRDEEEQVCLELRSRWCAAAATAAEKQS